MRSTRTSAAWAAMAMTTSLLAVTIVGAHPHAIDDAPEGRNLAISGEQTGLTTPHPDTSGPIAADVSHIAVMPRP
ncbi:MAG TPA: hypothetical protein VGE08_15665 [Steroidobacter sp.]|uniref:hypothetical protein n=1 Tax=Steroidobacter sp. TaxID=1978227 RepID=UPI002ED9CD62